MGLLSCIFGMKTKRSGFRRLNTFVMKSFKTWLEDVGGKNLNSMGADMNPTNTAQDTGQAVTDFTSTNASNPMITKLMGAGNGPQQNSLLTKISSNVLDSQNNPNNLKFDQGDVMRQLSLQFLGQPMRRMMRRMMAKKMGKK
jgi:hypothetical protein